MRSKIRDLIRIFWIRCHMQYILSQSCLVCVPHATWCELGIVIIMSQIRYQMVHTSAYTMAYPYDHMPHIKLTEWISHSRYKIGTHSCYYITKLFSYTAAPILFSKQKHVTKLTQHTTCSLHQTEHMQHKSRCNKCNQMVTM